MMYRTNLAYKGSNIHIRLFLHCLEEYRWARSKFRKKPSFQEKSKFEILRGTEYYNSLTTVQEFEHSKVRKIKCTIRTIQFVSKRCFLGHRFRPFGLRRHGPSSLLKA